MDAAFSKDKAYHENIVVHKIDSKYVSNGLSDIYKYWRHDSAVLISAPTGSGKNHFIIEELIPYASETNQQIFLFSNRIALNVQQKKILMHKLKIPNIYSDEEIKGFKQFRNVIILSYQEALSYLAQYGHQYPIGSNTVLGRPGYGFAVFDEVHFFLTDALFNAYTQQILKRLVFAFSYFTRIYMTATPDNIKNYIVQEEVYNQNKRQVTHDDVQRKIARIAPYNIKQNYQYYNIGASLNLYNFSRDYSDYNIKFFTKPEQIYSEMQSANKNNKWLYFMNSKNQQQKSTDSLPDELKKQTDYYDSSKKQDTKIWKSLMNGQIPKNILITTSALDNGVNITDDALHNIVIDCEDKISLVQMLGRKRKNKGETVNVFIQAPSINFITTRLQEIKNTLDFINNYNISPNNFLQGHWNDFHTKFRNLFYIDTNQHLVINELAVQELTIQYIFYSEVLFQMQEAQQSGNEQDALEIYPKKVLQWLKLPPDVQWINIEEKNQAISDLITLLDSHIETGIEEEKRNEFISKFCESASVIIQKNFKGDFRSGPSVMTKFLKENKSILGYSYKIEGRGTWRIIKNKL